MHAGMFSTIIQTGLRHLTFSFLIYLLQNGNDRYLSVILSQKNQIHLNNLSLSLELS